MKILSYRRFALWWQLAMDWFQRQFASISVDLKPVENKIDSLDEKITPYLYDPCTADDIDRMFEAQTEAGQIVIPAEAVQPDGSISLNLFTAITGLTPVVANEQE